VFRWVEHTGELELELTSPTAEGLFADALAALAELLGSETDTDGVRPRTGPDRPESSRELSLRADDRPALLAAWLDELVFLAETEGFVPEGVESLDLGELELQARIRGRPGDAPHLVKAVTYHRLELGRGNGGWRARAVLDV
jgi:SHS2 domain-containing protein